MNVQTEIAKPITVAEALKIVSLKTQAFIGGEFVNSLSGRTLVSSSPIDGSHLANVAACDERDVDLAVATARAAFDAGHWRNASPNDRRKTLLKFADVLEANAQELALLETLDLGKPIANTRSVDIPLTIETVRYYAEVINKVYDELGPSPSNAVSMIVREPVGVVDTVETTCKMCLLVSVQCRVPQPYNFDT